MAAIRFEQGDYRAAAEMYHQLVQENPDNSPLRASFAGALGALERYDAVVEQLDRAIELDPLNVEAYHNRAVIHERSGRPDAAIADYERAVRYRPGYEPSRAAFERLTGRPDPRAPSTESEARASRLAQQASDAARRGRYAEALELLDEAASVAPHYVVVYQYRSNVGYLMGDLELAREALERSLSIEPDNALFLANLERIRQRE